jgi:hypothetical protein
VTRRQVAVLSAIHAELAARQGSSEVDLVALHLAIRGRPGSDGATVVAEVEHQLQLRWSEVLGLPDLRKRHVELALSDVRARVEAAFACEDAGWAHYLSPDVLIAERGDGASVRRAFVLGEVHLRNTLLASVFVAHHPRSDRSRASTAASVVDELARAVEADLTSPCLIALPPRRQSSHRGRVLGHLLLADCDKILIFEYADETSSAPRSRVIRAGDLVVAPGGDGGLEVRSRDGRLRLDATELVSTLLERYAVRFEPFAAAPHVPRISIGRLICCRERWEIPADDLGFASLAARADRFLEVQRWAHDRFPRQVFVKSPVEAKPIYVDFDSPVAVDLLVKLARDLEGDPAGRGLRVSEMVPALDELWLTDGRGGVYTSELRFTARNRR